jgi:hypothetical protein
VGDEALEEVVKEDVDDVEELNDVEEFNDVEELLLLEQSPKAG